MVNIEWSPKWLAYVAAAGGMGECQNCLAIMVAHATGQVPPPPEGHNVGKECQCKDCT